MPSRHPQPASRPAGARADDVDVKIERFGDIACGHAGISTGPADADKQSPGLRRRGHFTNVRAMFELITPRIESADQKLKHLRRFL